MSLIATVKKIIQGRQETSIADLHNELKRQKVEFNKGTVYMYLKRLVASGDISRQMAGVYGPAKGSAYLYEKVLKYIPEGKTIRPVELREKLANDGETVEAMQMQIALATLIKKGKIIKQGRGKYTLK